MAVVDGAARLGNRRLTTSALSGAWAPVRRGVKLVGMMGTRRVSLESGSGAGTAGRKAKSMVEVSWTAFRAREVLRCRRAVGEEEVEEAASSVGR